MSDEMKKISIDSDLTIYTAMEFKSQLMGLIKPGAEIEFDLSNVSEFDTAGLQLLIMAKRDLLATGGQLHLVGHTPAVYEVLDMCHMIQYFGDPIVLPSQRKSSP